MKMESPVHPVPLTLHLQDSTATVLVNNSTSRQAAPAKPASSSYKIRIPGLAVRNAIATTAAQSSPSSPQKPTAGPGSTAPRQSGSATSTSSTSMPSPTQPSSEELEQLRAVRELMAVKGKQALLDWLRT